jgi:hypothetical protein
MIKEFKTIVDAVEYRQKCPVCNEELIFNSKDVMTNYYSHIGKLCFELMGEDLLFIDPRSQKIEISLKQSSQLLGYYNYNGLSYHRLGLECNCCMYDYTLQLQVDMSKQILHNILLNSERISYEDSSGILHEIKNTYVTNVTEYAYHDLHSISKTEKLPIIPLNLNNPQETVDKIQKLLIFS